MHGETLKPYYASSSIALIFKHSPQHPQCMSFRQSAKSGFRSKQNEAELSM